MTAVEIIDEIKHLEPGERQQVISYVRALDGQSSGTELNRLAEELVAARSDADVERLKEAIAQGFYGKS